MTFSRELIAASATPIVLGILSRGDSYGYEIIARVHESSKGAMEWSDGMLYPILHRLEKKGWVESYWQKTGTQRRRKYYRLLKSGRMELAKQRKSWGQTYSILQQLTGKTTCSA